MSKIALLRAVLYVVVRDAVYIELINFYPSHGIVIYGRSPIVLLEICLPAQVTQK